MEEIKVRTGYKIENYILEEMLGAGGFSTVYKARSIDPQPEYDTVIAIKVLHPRRLDRYQIRRFIREAKIAKKLIHPNIVKVYDFKKYEGDFFIFMEFLDADLLKCINARREIFSPSILEEIILKAAKGLSFIHQNRIIHKDFNPSNILVNFSLEKVKITDFGLAVKNTFFYREKREGGTLDYTAPEIIKGRKASIRSDIYSFGKTVEKLYNELNFPIPDTFRYIINISTRENPEERFSNMEEIIYMFEDYEI
ncbi:MAG TPA: serine/threonine-protein kinase [Candidatus Ratteibacteria bacterium]|nr:serine/threonine-protein kinase [Candidatus Ratteibacteria bacterium]